MVKKVALHFLTLIAFVGGSACHAAETADELEPLELSILRDKRDAAVVRINEQFVEALGKLQGKFVAAGDLEKALAIKDEADKTKATISGTPAPEARSTVEDPDELVAMREKRDKEVVEIDRRYLTELGKLQVKITKSGNLEQALVVRNEVAEVTARIDSEPEPLDPPQPKIENKFIGRWRYEPRSGTHERVFTQENKMILYRRGKIIWETDYKLESPTKAIVSESSVHRLREDGKLDIEGKHVAERVGDK